MSIKEELHELVDALPESELRVARRLLEYLRTVTDDPFLRALRDAPEDEEPMTAEQKAAVDKAWQRCLRGTAMPWEGVRKDLADGG